MRGGNGPWLPRADEVRVRMGVGNLPLSRVLLASRQLAANRQVLGSRPRASPPFAASLRHASRRLRVDPSLGSPPHASLPLARSRRPASHRPASPRLAARKTPRSGLGALAVENRAPRRPARRGGRWPSGKVQAQASRRPRLPRVRQRPWDVPARAPNRRPESRRNDERADRPNPSRSPAGQSARSGPRGGRGRSECLELILVGEQREAAGMSSRVGRGCCSPP
jgi:hypothetical protein